jgi:hypothetical protein
MLQKQIHDCSIPALERTSTLHERIPALGIGSSNCSSTGKRNSCLDKEGPKNLDNNFYRWAFR